MPYITNDKRPDLDNLISPLIDQLKSQPIEKQDGCFSYVITKIMKDLYEKKYFDYNRSMGVLSSVQAEWYRRHVAPYEDNKVSQNGDI